MIRQYAMHVYFALSTIITIRQYATADNVFDYFANYQVISESGEGGEELSTFHSSSELLGS